jgi:hypothetical protein
MNPFSIDVRKEGRDEKSSTPQKFTSTTGKASTIHLNSGDRNKNFSQGDNERKRDL